MHLGTSSFTAKGWEGAFYPRAIARSRWLEYYATRFDCVEIDSSFYAIPDPVVVSRWNEMTPPEFRFAFKAPQSITHERLTTDAQVELEQFLGSISVLGRKLAVILLQFPYFKRSKLATAEDLVDRIAAFVERLPRHPCWALEIRNADWVTTELVSWLAERNVALALIDHPYVGDARFWMQRLEAGGLGALPFYYIRLLGDRYAIEERTKVWYRTIEDRGESLDGWAELIRNADSLPGAKPGYVFANNHYEGFAPETLERLRTRLR